MSDHDDAMSEVAPEGWSVMFNQMNLGSPIATSPKNENQKSSNSETADASAGWFGGWFGTPAKTSKSKSSSISSDTPPIHESKENSDVDDDQVDDRAMMNNDDASSSSESGPRSDVDSDGYAVGSADEVEKALKAGSDVESSGHSSEDNKSVGVSSSASSRDTSLLKAESSVQMMTEVVPARTQSRRDRLKNRQQFQVLTHTASELVVPEEIPDEAVPEGEKSWWGTIFPVADPGIEPVALTIEEEIKPENKVLVQIPAETEDKPKVSDAGIWSRMFGPSEPVIQPRSLLPEIALPPSVSAYQDMNSYFPQQSLSSGIEILGPSRMFGRYEGKVRGWPRRLAPYWSSEPSADPMPQPSFSRPPSGASALAMFRVT